MKVAGRKWMLSNQAVQGNFGICVYGLEVYPCGSFWLVNSNQSSVRVLGKLEVETF